MKQSPYLIASYPRSGSTWLRFILANLLQPDTSHDFNTIDNLIPTIEDPEGVANAILQPLFFKTHQLRHSPQVIHLHRHVGDVLISEWWYKRKFHGDARPLPEYLEQDGYGKGWRDSIDHYFPCPLSISYNDLGVASMVWDLLQVTLPGRFSYQDVTRAVGRCTFAQLQVTEEKGFGRYPAGDPDIKFFREGKSFQWKSLEFGLQQTVLNANFAQLRVLGYV